MAHSTLERARIKVSASVDARLLAAVDAFVAKHPGTDRSKVIDAALRLWYAQEQERAMEAQFAASEQAADNDERSAWRETRRVAAERRFSR